MQTKALSQYLNKQESIAVIGLGYTGLPLAIRLAKSFNVVGYDSDLARVQQLCQGMDANQEIKLPDPVSSLPIFTYDRSMLVNASVFIIAVPTPVDQSKIPDLRYIDEAMDTVGKSLKSGDCVVIESTVYPGCTDEYCAPLLEKISGLKVGVDFVMGYSPERINPGDNTHHIGAVVKLVAASDSSTLEFLAQLYQHVTDAGVHACESIRVAEAAKLTENIQRDVNIALLNELSAVYEKLGINPGSVWEAAATKWNFLPFRPGLAGGHCISVDPYYLLSAIKEHGIKASLVEESRRINEGMVERVASKIFQHLQTNAIAEASHRILIMGASFKPNVKDVRNSKPVELAKLLMRRRFEVDLIDPLVDSQQLKRMSGLTLAAQPTGCYQVVVVAVNHIVYKELEESYFCAHSFDSSLIIDLTGAFKGVIHNRKYWTI